MEVLGLYLLLCLPIGLLATSYGRSGFGWFLGAALLSPLIMGIALLIAGRRRDLERVPCPVCAEEILRKARKCHFCGTDLAAPEPYQRRTLAENLSLSRADPPAS